MNLKARIAINMNLKEKVCNMKKYVQLLSVKTRYQCFGIISLAFISSALGAIYPVRLGNIYTDITEGRIASLRDGIIPIMTFGILFLVSEGLIIFRRIALDCVIASHEADIRKRSIEKILKMPVFFTFGEMNGKRNEQLRQSIEGLSQLIRIYCNDVIAMLLITAFTLTQVVRHASWSMAAVMLACLVISILISRAQINSQNGVREAILDKKTSLQGQVGQSIAGLELIRSLSAESYAAERLNPQINEIGAAERRHHVFMGTFDGIKKLCAIAFHIIILLFSVGMISRNEMEPGAVIALCLLFQQLLRPLDDIYRFLDETASSKIKTKLLIEMAAIKEDPVFGIADSSQAHTGNGTDIVLQGVSTTTPEKDKVIACYQDQTIPCKEIVALIGASGSGKTSMIRTLNRYFPHINGRIMVLGRDLASYSQRELTERLFYTPQTQFFFSGTIRENLMFGLREEVGDKALIDALKNAALFDTLYWKAKENTPAEVTDESILAYRIGEGGAGLSGGEFKRLSIARAFLRKPDVFIFDESTTNIDEDTVNIILTNIEQYAKRINAGIIYITHEDHIIKRCRCVINLENNLKLAS